MKTKFMLGFLVLIGMTACDNDAQAPDMPTAQDMPETISSYEANEDEAINSAALFFEGMKGKSRSEIYKEVESIGRVKSHSSRSEEDGCGFYLINFEDGGFALTSADKRDSVKVYMASTNLKMDEEFLQNDDFMSYMMSLIEGYQNHTVNENNVNKNYSRSRDPLDNGGYLVTTTTVNYNVGPLLTTTWCQGSPFNYTLVLSNSPNQVMGCGPVAVGQVMAFHEKPSSLHNTTLNWSKIKSVTENTNPGGYGVAEVSSLLKTIGEDLGINYSGKDRGVSGGDIYNVMKSYGYTLDKYSDYNYYNVVSSVRNNRPVIMSGFDSKTKVGHAWVVDGAYAYTVETLLYDENGNHVPNDIVISYNTIDRYEYIYVNAGWGSDYLYKYMTQIYCDTMVDDMRPFVHVLSNIFKMGTYNFDSKLKMYCNIR